MILNIVSKYKVGITLFLIAMAIYGWMWIEHKIEIARLNRYLDRSREEIVEQFKEDSLAKVEYAEKNKELEILHLLKEKSRAVNFDQNIYFKVFDLIFRNLYN